MSALKNYPRGVGRGICGGAGCARTPTYTGPLLEVDLFSVESHRIKIIQLITLTPIDEPKFLSTGSQIRRELRPFGCFTLQVDKPTNIRQGLRLDTYLTPAEKFDTGQDL